MHKKIVAEKKGPCGFEPGNLIRTKYPVERTPVDARGEYRFGQRLPIATGTFGIVCAYAPDDIDAHPEEFRVVLVETTCFIFHVADMIAISTSR